MVIRQTDALAQRPGPGFCSPWQAPINLHFLFVPFSMFLNTRLPRRAILSAGLAFVHSCVPCMSMQRTHLWKLLKKFKNTNKISGANNKCVQIFPRGESPSRAG